MEIKKCFKILEISPDSSLDEVKQAYRDLVQVYHPDRFTHNERLRKKAENKIKTINLAYENIERFFISGRNRQENQAKATEDERPKPEAAMNRERAQQQSQAYQEPKTKYYSGIEEEPSRNFFDWTVEPRNVYIGVVGVVVGLVLAGIVLKHLPLLLEYLKGIITIAVFYGGMFSIICLIVYLMNRYDR